jgi:hypothetical protein
MNQVILNSITVFRNSLEFSSCIGMIEFNFNERKKRLVHMFFISGLDNFLKELIDWILTFFLPTAQL